MALSTSFPIWLRVYLDDNILLAPSLREQIRSLWFTLRPFTQNRLGVLLVSYYYLQKDIITRIADAKPDFYKDFTFFRQKKHTLALAKEEQKLFLQEEKLLDELLSFLG
jgi:hypothetical protein